MNMHQLVTHLSIAKDRLRKAAPDLYEALDDFFTPMNNTTAAVIKAMSGWPWSRPARHSPKPGQ